MKFTFGLHVIRLQYLRNNGHITTTGTTYTQPQEKEFLFFLVVVLMLVIVSLLRIGMKMEHLITLEVFVKLNV